MSINHDIDHDIQQSHRLLAVFKDILLEDRMRYGNELPAHLMAGLAQFTSDAVYLMAVTFGVVAKKNGSKVTGLQLSELFREELITLIEGCILDDESEKIYT